MITRAFAENFKDTYEEGLTVQDYVDFFKECQRTTEEETETDASREFRKLDEKELSELAELVIEINEE